LDQPGPEWTAWPTNQSTLIDLILLKSISKLTHDLDKTFKKCIETKNETINHNGQIILS
jgi:hypothetical protein